MNWIKRFFSLFSVEKLPDIVPNTGIRIQGEIVDDAEYDAIIAHYNRRITQCDSQIEKWTNRIKSGIYSGVGLSEMRGKIKAIKATRSKFESLIKRDKRK